MHSCANTGTAGQVTKSMTTALLTVRRDPVLHGWRTAALRATGDAAGLLPSAGVWAAVGSASSAGWLAPEPACMLRLPAGSAAAAAWPVLGRWLGWSSSVTPAGLISRHSEACGVRAHCSDCTWWLGWLGGATDRIALEQEHENRGSLRLVTRYTV